MAARMTEATRLARRLGPFDAVVIGLGSMVGAGIFAAIAPAARAAGSALLIGLVLAGAVAYCNATSSARLAALYPESGGTYVYGRRRLRADRDPRRGSARAGPDDSAGDPARTGPDVRGLRHRRHGRAARRLAGHAGRDRRAAPRGRPRGLARRARAGRADRSSGCLAR